MLSEVKFIDNLFEIEVSKTKRKKNCRKIVLYFFDARYTTRYLVTGYHYYTRRLFSFGFSIRLRNIVLLSYRTCCSVDLTNDIYRFFFFILETHCHYTNISTIFGGFLERFVKKSLEKKNRNKV